MFKAQTVFVVGAGASCEVGLPDGKALKARIAEMLNIQRDDYTSPSDYTGDVILTRAILDYVSRTGNPQNGSYYFDKCRTISRALPLAASIDNYLENHRGDDVIKHCGKMAIVRAVLDAEHHSKLYYDRNREDLDFSQIEESWLVGFWKLLVDKIDVDEVEQAFENVSFIIFNYDRCVEHFLFESLKCHFSISDERAAAMLRNVRFLHPYGSVGPLPFQEPNAHQSVPFGQGESTSALPRIISNTAEKIRTFTEKFNDKQALEIIQDTMNGAKSVVYLGFAYHEQNMKLIQSTKDKCQVVRVLGTVLGFYKSDAEDIEKSVRRQTGRQCEQYNFEAMKCIDLFNGYSRTMASAA